MTEGGGGPSKDIRLFLSTKGVLLKSWESVGNSKCVFFYFPSISFLTLYQVF